MKAQLNKRIKWLLRLLLIVVVLLNAIAFMHAYKFTHFSKGGKSKSTTELSVWEKTSLLFTGVRNPRPQNTQAPDTAYETVLIQSNKLLEAWWIKRDSAKGTVALFHGYGGEKSSMLDKAAVFRQMGYNTLLVDFMGAGRSEGRQTTVGFFEAQEVKDCLAYLKEQGETNIHLFGTSMGAVAIMKAIDKYNIQPASIIIECPFGTMMQTVKARFKIMGVPSFPMAQLLVFWGGIQNGFWAFEHNPVEYAKNIHCPTLLLYGEHDPKVSRSEIDAIYANLKGKKQLKTYPEAGHENYLTNYKEAWVNDIEAFMK